ncbi:MAG TPA: dihydroorotate dehydrogenase electron transfer subunit [Tepidisphaeraceae bacterium]|nr:dihydroorotate dehydrogenase electron transfer subunit [Tepidisphaeraceae bacterium]
MAGKARGQFVSTVKANLPLCREHYRLVLGVVEFPPTEPGQFVQVSCRDVREVERLERELEWATTEPLQLTADTLLTPGAMLRRPFSLAGRRDVGGGGVELDIIHRVVGIGTDWLSRLSPGDEVGIVGPLGNQFVLPPEGATAVLVGGGVGIPPMLYLAEKLAGRPAVAFAGALTGDLLPFTIRADVSPDGANPTPAIEEFARHGISSVITTDDGSYGFRGFVTQALEQYLDQSGFGIGVSGFGDNRTNPSPTRHPRPDTRDPKPDTPHPIAIYTCGPEPMMKRVADIAAARNIDCQIAVERAMACGMGTCQSCCIRVKKPDPQQPPLVGRDWCYRLACTDGPVFHGADLLW